MAPGRRSLLVVVIREAAPPVAPASADRRLDAPATGRSWADSSAVAMALLVAFAVVFLVQAWPRIEAPFGDSHDGENAAVWGLASRAIRNQGLLQSRAGARLADHGELYAHHPPLISTETATVETVAGTTPVSTRAPAWLGSLASLLLLYWLLRLYGIRRVPSALGVVIGFGSPMFFLYGSMLDTLQIGLPLVIALLAVRRRHERTGRPRSAVIAAVAALTVLASWEGALLAGLLAVADGVAMARDRRRRRLGTMAGVTVGVVILLAWLWWAAGSFGPILDQLGTRSGYGSRTTGWATFLHLQGVYLGALFAPTALLALIPGAYLASRSRRLRPVFVVTLVAPIVYALALRDGASNHDYWNYWLVVPLAIAAAALAQRLFERAEQHAVPPAVVVGAAVAAAVVAVVLAFPTTTTAALRSYQNGEPAAGLVAEGARSRSPVYLAGRYQGDIYWADYATARARSLGGVGAVKAAAGVQPEAPVIVKCAPALAWLRGACGSGGPIYRRMSISRLERLLHTG